VVFHYLYRMTILNYLIKWNFYSTVFVERITNIEGNLLYCSQSVCFEKKMFLL
jgi:hypothetical protein